MARRPRPPEEILTRKELAELQHRLSMMSVTALHDFYNGGESGIRTHVTLSSKHAFQACAFSHSAISPAYRSGVRRKEFLRRVCAAEDFFLILWVNWWNRNLPE